MGEWLHRYEAKGIQSWIMQTDRLREIKGGSALIEDLSELLRDALEAQGRGGEIVAAAAGAATTRFPDQESALDLAAVWPMLVDRFAPGLELVQAVVDADATDLTGLRLSLARDRALPRATLPEAGPTLFRAPRTGLPAEPFETARELLDRATARRGERGNETGADALERRLLPKKKRWLLNLDDLGASWIGVVHIDGNDMGLRVQGLSPGDLPAFSEALSATTTGAAQEALEEALAEVGALEDEPLPVRPIVLGGDDVTMLLRGDLAVPFARHYLEAFERLGRKKAEALAGPVTACAGVALVHTGYPFHRAAALAEELCGFSKMSLRRDAGQGSVDPTPSGLSLHRVTTSMTGTWEEILNSELRSSCGRRSLTAAPYTLQATRGFPSIGDLERLVKAMERLPSGPMRESIGLIAEDPARSMDLMERLGTVMSERSAAERQAWRTFSDALQGSQNGAVSPSPWRTWGPQSDINATMLWDAYGWMRAESAHKHGGDR